MWLSKPQSDNVKRSSGLLGSTQESRSTRIPRQGSHSNGGGQCSCLDQNKLKGRNINLPSDYIQITEKARLTKPLTARLLHYDDFRNYNDTRLFRYNSIRPGKTVGDDTVQDLRMLNYNPNGTISFKVDFDDDLKLLPRLPKKPTLSYKKLEPLYSAEIKISAQRYDHLQDLKVVLPSNVHEFYDNLKHE